MKSMATIQDEEKKIKVVAVVGPTGCGKSQFAIELAHKIDGEIISCDSMAVYKGVEIATDKIPEQQREVDCFYRVAQRKALRDLYGYQR